MLSRASLAPLTALHVTADVLHVFQSFAGSPDEADAALDRAGRFILDQLDGKPRSQESVS